MLLHAPPTTRLREFFMRRVWRHSPLKLVGYWPLPLTSLYFPCFLTYEYTEGLCFGEGCTSTACLPKNRPNMGLACAF